MIFTQFPEVKDGEQDEGTGDEWWPQRAALNIVPESPGAGERHGYT
jgi:hypothetical protein